MTKADGHHYHHSVESVIIDNNQLDFCLIVTIYFNSGKQSKLKIDRYINFNDKLDQDVVTKYINNYIERCLIDEALDAFILIDNVVANKLHEKL